MNLHQYQPPVDVRTHSVQDKLAASGRGRKRNCQKQIISGALVGITVIFKVFYFLLRSTYDAMAPTKPRAGSSKTRSSGSGKQPTLKRVKGENFYRDAKAASRLKMLNGGKPVRDRDGKIIQAAAFQKGEDETKPGRVQPDRRWFGE